MTQYKAYFTSGHNILFQDDQDQLFICGDNVSQQASPSESNIITVPVKINVSLKINERVINFKSYTHNILIHTNQNRLILLYSSNTSNYSGSYLPINLSGSSLQSIQDDDSQYDIDPEDNDLITDNLSTLTSRPFPPVVQTVRSPRTSPQLSSNRDVTSRMRMYDVDEEFEELPAEIVSRNPQTEVNPTSREMLNWRPVTHAQFNDLTESARAMYLACARRRIAQDLGNETRNWSHDTDLVATVLEQIEGIIPSDIPSDQVQEEEDEVPPLVETFDTESTQNDETMTDSVVPQESVIVPLVETEISVTTSDDHSRSNTLRVPTVVNTLQDYLIPNENSLSMTFHRQFTNEEPVILENVINIIFGEDTILYQKGTQFIIEIFNGKPGSNMGNKYGLLPTILDKENTNCHEICFPFEIKMYAFKSHFLYVKSEDEHHIIAPFSRGDHCMQWFHFKADFFVDSSKIYWNRLEQCIYIESVAKNVIYVQTGNNLKPLITREIPYIFIDDMYDHIFCVYDRIYLYTGYGFTKFCNLSSVVHSSIEDLFIFPKASSTFKSKKNYHNESVVIVLHNGSALSNRVTFSSNIIYVSGEGLEHKSFLKGRGMAFICDSKLNVIVNNTIDWTVGTVETSRLSNDSAHLQYHLPMPQTEIVRVSWGDSIVIETATNKYYAHIYDNFSLKSFHTVPKIQKFPVPRLVHTNLVSSDRNASRSNSLSIRIQLRDSFMTKLLSLAEMFNADFFVSVTNFELASNVAHGEGTNRNFFEKAVLELAEFAFITHNYLTELNIDALEKLNDAQLYVIGKALVMIINNIGSHLPIRLPLILVAAIRRRLPTKAALEFFAIHEDPEALNHLRTMENSPSELKAACYDDYMHGLHCLCKFDNYPEPRKGQAYEIARKIANGFLYNSTFNQARYNMPTLDYYLSGPFKIDIERIISNIFFHNQHVHGPKLLNFIRSLPDDKLRILLANWTGSSVPSRSLYHIKIESNSRTIVIFTTCSRLMTISDKLFTNYPEAMWADILASECWMMQG